MSRRTVTGASAPTPRADRCSSGCSGVPGWRPGVERWAPFWAPPTPGGWWRRNYDEPAGRSGRGTAAAGRVGADILSGAAGGGLMSRIWDLNLILLFNFYL